MLVVFVKEVIGCVHLSSEYYYILLLIVMSNIHILRNRTEAKKTKRPDTHLVDYTIIKRELGLL
jgi:hypothetical protein